MSIRVIARYYTRPHLHSQSPAYAIYELHKTTAFGNLCECFPIGTKKHAELHKRFVVRKIKEFQEIGRANPQRIQPAFNLPVQQGVWKHSNDATPRQHHYRRPMPAIQTGIFSKYELSL